MNALQVHAEHGSEVESRVRHVQHVLRDLPEPGFSGLSWENDDSAMFQEEVRLLRETAGGAGVSLWKCKCGVLNQDDSDVCAYCDMPRNPEAFDGISVEDDTKVLPAIKREEKQDD